MTMEKKNPLKRVFSRYIKSDSPLGRASSTDSPSEKESTDGGPTEAVETGGDDSINVVVR